MTHLGHTGRGWIAPLALALALAASAPALASDPPAAPGIRDLRAATAGAWCGRLEYRDYQSNAWVGIPVAVDIEVAGDGVTLIRRAVFDDGPRRGAVYITSIEMLGADGSSEYSTSFRAGQQPSLGAYTLTPGAVRDAEHWTLVATQDGTDDDRPARIRETTTRDGGTLTTLKEVDFADDGDETWLARNRVTLERQPGGAEPPSTRSASSVACPSAR